MRKTLESLVKAPDSQLDERIRARILLLLEKGYDEHDIKKILDDCAYGALASDFVMVVLDLVWKELQNPGQVLKNAEQLDK